MRPRVIPCLLLKNSGLVKTTKFKDPKYVGDPINAVKIFNEKGADELLILDIEATVSNREPNYDVITQVVMEAFMPVAYGGGVNQLEQARRILAIGVEKIVLSSAAIKNLKVITEISNYAGSQSVTVCIDIKKNFWGKNKIAIQNGTKFLDVDILQFVKEIEYRGAGEIILNNVDRDGTMQGYDIELLRLVADSVTIPVIACGGAGSSEHLHQAVKMGKASAVSAGSMFVFQGKHRAVLITYPSDEELNELFKDYLVT